jgi:hypothetical protein
MNWRPTNPYAYSANFENFCELPVSVQISLKAKEEGWERGVSATLSVLIKWLWEDCNQHYGITHVRHLRQDCPQCMAELRGEK